MLSALPAYLALPAEPKLRLLEGGGVDAELVSRIRRGDKKAEHELYQKYVGYVMGLAVRLLGRKSEAEDVVQDTFVIALEQMDKLRDPSAVRGWLAQVAVSQARRRFRRRKLLIRLGMDRGEEDAPLDSLARESITPEETAELSLLNRVLSDLPEAERFAWMLRHVEGEELEACARACACSLATVKRRIAAADVRIRAMVALPEDPT